MNCSMSNIINMSNQSTKTRCECFKIPKPIPPSTQPGGKLKCGQKIQAAMGPHAYQNTKALFVKINVNHFNSFEGAPYGYGAPPKNNII